MGRTLVPLAALCVATLLSLIAVVVSAQHLPRHVTEATSERPIAEALYKKATVVVAIVSDVTAAVAGLDPLAGDGNGAGALPGESALLEAFTNASMAYVQTPASDVRFFVVSSAAAAKPAAAATGAATDNSDPPDTDAPLTDDVGAGPVGIPKALAIWIGKHSELHHRRGITNGIFVFRRTEGDAANRLWKEWAGEKDTPEEVELKQKEKLRKKQEAEKDMSGPAPVDPEEGDDDESADGAIQIPTEVLPVSVQEILLSPEGIAATTHRIVRRVRCMLGPNVHHITTFEELENFVLNPCTDNGMSVVAWPRPALWPYAQKVEKDKLQQLGIVHQAMATIAAADRPYTSFAWVDKDSPIIQNISLLAFLNGAGAPVVAYVCDDRCKNRGQPFSLQEITIKLFPFKPFGAVKYMPKGEVREFLHVAFSEYLSEVHEAASGVGEVSEIEVGVAPAEFDRLSQEQQQRPFHVPATTSGAADAGDSNGGGSSKKKHVVHINNNNEMTKPTWCEAGINKDDAVAAIILGESLSLDKHSKPKSTHFFRSNDLQRGDSYVVGKKNTELPPQFGLVGHTHFFNRMCFSPVTRAQVLLRANRHYNHTELPPRIEMYATLRFSIEILGRGVVPQQPKFGSARGGGFVPPEQPHYEDQDEGPVDPNDPKYTETRFFGDAAKNAGGERENLIVDEKDDHK